MNVQSNDPVAVGRCPEHGYVHGEDVDYRFPMPAECAICGRELDRTTVADRREVEALA